MEKMIRNTWLYPSFLLVYVFQTFTSIQDSIGWMAFQTCRKERDTFCKLSNFCHDIIVGQHLGWNCWKCLQYLSEKYFLFLFWICPLFGKLVKLAFGMENHATSIMKLNYMRGYPSVGLQMMFIYMLSPFPPSPPPPAPFLFPPPWKAIPGKTQKIWLGQLKLVQQSLSRPCLAVGWWKHFVS